jgi:hypothetical protein
VRAIGKQSLQQTGALSSAALNKESSAKFLSVKGFLPSAFCQALDRQRKVAVTVIL